MQLLPVQREFFATDAPSHSHNTKAVLLTAPPGLDLPRVIEALYHRHDALRLRFVFAGGLWQAVEAPVTAAMIAESCVLERLPEDTSLQPKFISERCAHYLHSLDITHGPLFRAVHLQGHAEKQGRLFLVVHQLVVDDVAWRVLLRDLDVAYRQAHSGKPIQLTIMSSSYQQWGEALAAYATSDALQRERGYWHDNSARKAERWPVPPLSKEAASYASVRTVPVQLSVAETTALTKDCTGIYHTTINELLLCAVYLAMREWSGQTRLRMTLEENGREKLFPEIDITETVGCFTTRYPLVLHSEARDLSAVIKSVKEQHRVVPHRGIGYGLLRYIAGDEVLIRAAAAEPSFLLFKYLGELNQVMQSNDPQRLRSHALCLTGAVVGGALRFKLEYSERQYSKDTMTELARHLEEALRALIAHSREPEAGYFTPSDFPLATVDQATLNEWQTTYAIEQLYPATAMQKGMFFHSLLELAAYVTQLYSTLDGDLQVPVLQQAWQTVIDRHAMLRTVFVGEGEEQHQLVIRRALLPWYEEDLRELSAAEQNALFEDYRQADRARGFEPTQAPLMRLSLFRLKDDQYRLLWSHHHSLLDGWSIRLVFTEVMQVYTQLAEGVDPVLPAVAEYARYVEWLLTQDAEQARRYWQTYLADIETVTRLPYDRPPHQQEPLHEVQEITLSVGDVARLRELAKRHHTTVNTLLQLAWGLVLRSYSGDKEVVFGAVISGRLAEVPEVERMVGLTINTIPVVASFNGNESLAESISHLHSTFQQSQKYAYLPLTEIQQQSRLSRGTPLFESLLVFENYTLELTKANGAGPVRMGEFGANLQDTFPLELSMFQGESLQVLCKYFGDLFSAATIRRMLEHFIRVLQQLPNCDAVTDIRLLLSEAEQQQLLAWNDTAAVYPREQMTYDLFTEQAARTPAAVAVEYEDARLSYGELNRRANQLARYLRRLGVGPEIRVGLCLERSLELVVALLSILKAGGAYVPLDRDYPLERLRFVVDDAQLRFVLTNEQAPAGLADETGAQIIDLTAAAEQISRESEAELETAVSADNLAYVIYTSGSTGIPKGVAITHGNASAFTHWAVDFFSAPRLQAVLASTSINFDLSVFELFTPLCVGGRVILVENALQLATLPANAEVELVNMVPSAMAELVRQRAVPSSVRVVNLAGEPLLRKLVQEIYALGTVEQVINLYGPSEDTTYSTYEVVADAPDETVLIGRPISNSQIYLLDRTMQPVVIGVPGELCIAGDGLARGYLNRAQLTAERFLPNPFAREAGARLYRTGDLARYREDGRIEYLGRLDQQVKIRGYRIELGEIEARLERHPLVRECVVTATEAKAGGKRLVAYVVEAETVTVTELRGYLKEKLPEYMVPQVFVKLQELPLTANGKVDRKRLPAAERSGEEERGYVAPRTPEEELLAGVWAEVLGVDRVSVHDNFFERGGHSLLATQVVSRIRALFGIELPLRALFETTTTLEELAQQLVAARQTGAVGGGPVIQPRSRETAPALSYAQQRLWFLDQFEPQTVVYNVPATIYLRGELDRAALAQSLAEIARRHEVLRTTFPSVDGQPVQLITPAEPVDLPLIDLQALTEQDREILIGRYSTKQKGPKHEFTFSGLLNTGHWEDVCAQQLAAEEAARPFDLAYGPLWRVALLRLAEQEHVLVLTMHHIVTDGWSIAVLIRELTTLYEAYSRGEEPALATLPIQYADYAEWQREWLQGEVLEEQLEYWREQLAGSSGLLELPTDYARPPVQSHRGSSLTVPLDDELTRGLRELSQREGVTLFMTLLSGWLTLLARYSGQWDINVGTPIANRTRGETEDLIGFFVNTLVLRTQMNPEASFREQLQQVREVCLGAYAHQDVPFEMLVEELQPERDMRRSPLFQVMFALQNAPLGKVEIPTGLKLEPLAVELDTTKFDLMLALMETETGLAAWCNYRTDLFEEATIARMLEHWQVLLEAAVADPEQSLSALPLLLTGAELEQLRAWNYADVVDAQAEKCLHEIIEAQVEKTPHEIALVSRDGLLTYTELNEQANQLAHYLRARGVGPDSLVGIMMERSAAMIVTLLGILKAGGSYLPLDPDYPGDRLRFMIEDAEVEVLVSAQHLADRLPEVSISLVLFDIERNAIQQESAANPVNGLSPDNLAYVLYTSGSTGQPKGAMLAHREVVNCVLWMQQTYQLSERDRMLCKTTLNFDPSVWEIFWPLMVGSRIVIAAPEDQLNSSALVRTIIKEQVTVAYFVPSMLAMFLSEPEITGATSLRQVICGGESLSAELMKRFYELLPHATLHHSYGPTETAIAAAEIVCDPHSSHSTMPIGRPAANLKLYVLDEQLQPVPNGLMGELFVGGAGLGRGYFNRPDLTAEKFIPDHLGAVRGGRLYRTGDLVRYLADGNLQFHGRADTQVKLRGVRIELGEIESAIMAHEKVQTAVVVVRTDQTGEKSLVSYIVAAPNTNPNATELRQTLIEKLPAHMVPASFVFLAELPLMLNGKVDRQALPAPKHQMTEPTNGHVGPRNPVEELIAGVWSDVLGIKAVSVESDFFVAGGHSLSATQVVARLRQIFGVDISLRSLFEKPTIAGLAEIVSAAMNNGGPRRDEDIRPITRASRNANLSLSFAQERLWFWEQLQPGTPTYNLDSAFRIDGDLNVPILEQSVNEIMRRHEILRTSYVEVDGHPVQIVMPHSFVHLNVMDLSYLPEPERDFEARRLAGEQAMRPFDLTAAPLLRVSLLRLGAREHVVLVTMHHIVSDLWSVGVLVEEIAALYQEFLHGNPSPLPELPLQYADFANWQRERLKGELLTDQLAYWKDQLRDAPTLQLRTDRKRPHLFNSRGSIVPVKVPAELLRELKALARKNHVTLFMTLLAAFDVLLHRHTGQDDIVVGTDIANRTRLETEKLIGFFVNMLVLRTDLTGDPTFTELLRRVRETTIGAYAHQDVPFAKLVDEFHIRRELTRNPLFQVVFVLQNAPIKELQLSGLTLAPVELEVRSAPFDLSVVLSETADALTGAVTYSTELFDEQTVQQLVEHYQNVLEGVVAAPDKPLSSLAILQDSEIDSHVISDFEVKLSRKDLEGVLLELGRASHSQ